MSKSVGQVAKCKFCGALYRIYAHMVGDQSCCPDCRAAADRTMRGRGTWQ